MKGTTRMNAGFVGKYEDIKTYSKIFRSAYEGKSDKIKICGVLSTTLESTTSLAIEHNIKAYLSLGDLIKECDIIFICYTSDLLDSFINKLRSMRVRNKILCHFCQSHTSSDMEISITNTYYAITFPYMAEDFNSAVLFEGGGKNQREFEDIIRLGFPNSVFANHPTRILCRIALRFLDTYMKMSIRLSKYIFARAGIYDKNQFDALAKKCLFEELTKECEFEHIKASAVKCCMENLKTYNHPYLIDYIKTNEKFIEKEGNSYDK